jgi:hypothetical protein
LASQTHPEDLFDKEASSWASEISKRLSSRGVNAHGDDAKKIMLEEFLRARGAGFDPTSKVGYYDYLNAKHDFNLQKYIDGITAPHGGKPIESFIKRRFENNDERSIVEALKYISHMESPKPSVAIDATPFLFPKAAASMSKDSAPPQEEVLRAIEAEKLKKSPWVTHE